MYQNWSVAARAVSDRAVADAIKRKCALVELAHFLGAMLEDPRCAASRWLKDEVKLDAAELAPLLEPLKVGIPTEKRPGKYGGEVTAMLAFVSGHTSGRERKQVTTLDLLEALLRQAHDPAAKLLDARGASVKLAERAVEGNRFRD